MYILRFHKLWWLERQKNTGKSVAKPSFMPFFTLKKADTNKKVKKIRALFTLLKLPYRGSVCEETHIYACIFAFL